jgi:uncharacterized membrane protein (UPF0127 family)
MRKIPTLLVVFTLVLLSQVRFIPLYVGSVKLLVEVADTREKRVRGLMFRQSMPDDSGMLLVFDQEDIQGIWMKNMRFNLDIIFLNKEKQVLQIFPDVPPCRNEPCPSYICRHPAKYVLEIKGNRCRELGIKPGDVLFFKDP